MKKIFFLLFLLTTVSAKSQDTVSVTISAQARDLEYIGTYIFNDNSLENLYDSIKSKFRVPITPSGNTTVSITAQSMDWIAVLVRLREDPLALKANCTQRIQSLLQGLNNNYINARITDLDVADAAKVSDTRNYGRRKLRRQ